MIRIRKISLELKLRAAKVKAQGIRLTDSLFIFSMAIIVYMYLWLFSFSDLVIFNQPIKQLIQEIQWLKIIKMNYRTLPWVHVHCTCITVYRMLQVKIIVICCHYKSMVLYMYVCTVCIIVCMVKII